MYACPVQFLCLMVKPTDGPDLLPEVGIVIRRLVVQPIFDPVGF
jgi:hypothetical protein